MKLSLIMPVYNSMSTVKRSIDSFHNLSRVVDCECVLYIVDDCSTDNTLTIIKDAERGSNNIRVLQNKKNMGPGTARNMALSIIHDGYIGFLDSDDKILSSGYSEALKTGFREKPQLITFNGYVETDNNLIEKYDFDRIPDNTADMVRRCMRSELDGSVIFSIYDAEFIHKNNFMFPSGYYEDISFSYGALIKSRKRLIIDEFCYKKNNRNGSIVNSISIAHIDGMLNACISVRKKVIDSKLSGYEDFNADFSYGAHGYLSHIIISILSSDKTKYNKKEMLAYMYDKIQQNPILSGMSLRNCTKKDRLVSYYLNNYGSCSGDEILLKINKYYLSIFG